MNYVKGLTKEQHETIKSAAKASLPGIKLIIKRRANGIIDIYPRVSKEYSLNRWNKEDALKIANFLTANGIVFITGAKADACTTAYEGYGYAV